jgi:hypothetical protein
MHQDKKVFLFMNVVKIGIQNVVVYISFYKNISKLERQIQYSMPMKYCSLRKEFKKVLNGIQSDPPLLLKSI